MNILGNNAIFSYQGECCLHEEKLLSRIYIGIDEQYLEDLTKKLQQLDGYYDIFDLVVNDKDVFDVGKSDWSGEGIPNSSFSVAFENSFIEIAILHLKSVGLVEM